jgi:hypothetical protein
MTTRTLPSASGYLVFERSREPLARYQTKVDAIEAESAMPTMIAPSASPDRETNGT